jgi:hypothetical protein
LKKKEKINQGDEITRIRYYCIANKINEEKEFLPVKNTIDRLIIK